jgi:hypothetical protein
METMETRACEDCGASFPTQKALQFHGAATHLQWSRGRPDAIDPTEQLPSSPGGDESPRNRAFYPRSFLSGEGPDAPRRSEDPHAGDHGPTEDPVIDRSGRAPNFPGKEIPPTGPDAESE